MSIIIEKRNVSPFSNVDQRDFDKAVRDARLKQWRNGGRKQFEKDVNWKGAPQRVEEISSYLKQFSFEEKQAFIKGVLFIKEMHSLAKHDCEKCLDTGWVREITGIWPPDREEAEESYSKGQAGSPDGAHCFTEPSKCTEC
tara:strand:+ start:398 stop:820 length:423 start_codon:yes stop_codon:yes gene_type:complete